MTRTEIRISSLSSAAASLRETLLRSQIDHVARAPHVCRYRARGCGGEEDRVVVLDHVATRVRQLMLNVINRRHQCESPQTAIQVFRSRTEWSNFLTQHEPDFRTLVNKMPGQRSRLHHTALESFRQITTANLRQTRVEHDRDPLLVLRSE